MSWNLSDFRILRNLSDFRLSCKLSTTDTVAPLMLECFSFLQSVLFQSLTKRQTHFLPLTCYFLTVLIVFWGDLQTVLSVCWKTSTIVISLQGWTSDWGLISSTCIGTAQYWTAATVSNLYSSFLSKFCAAIIFRDSVWQLSFICLQLCNHNEPISLMFCPYLAVYPLYGMYVCLCVRVCSDVCYVLHVSQPENLS